jgi:hypothetical protein
MLIRVSKKLLILSLALHPQHLCSIPHLSINALRAILLVSSICGELKNFDQLFVEFVRILKLAVLPLHLERFAYKLMEITNLYLLALIVSLSNLPVQVCCCDPGVVSFNLEDDIICVLSLNCRAY